MSTDEEPFYCETLFEEAGQNGYDSYRVPGVVVTHDGRVIAYYDARRGNGDSATQTLFYRWSNDCGMTWSDRVSLVEGTKNQRLHNIVMVVDRIGNVHAFWNESYIRCFYRMSTDGGITWKAPTDISDTFEAFKALYPWNVYSIGPGHGITMRSGRMVIPAWLSSGGNTHQPSAFACIYSDDQGKSWTPGGIVNHGTDIVNPNEGSLVELRDKTLCATIRHDTLDFRCRAFVRSYDEGRTWGKVCFERHLPDPICHASIARFGDSGLLFSNCAWEDEKGVTAIRNGKKIKWSDDARQNLTVRLSLDEGQTWPYAKCIAKQGGYSDLYASRDGDRSYCIFEKAWTEGNCIFPQKIMMSVCNRKWLMSNINITN
jgi:sialidase-1